ncbi:sensor histidine kinase [Aeromicrobium sp.]|uniref:sensor histidine kinase n=1 Tax=Aeromicrobium sp. TaxID=1871063 RepID=UPI003D6C4A79
MQTTAVSGFSVRQRLTAAVALLTATALVAVGIALYAVESRRLAADVDQTLAQEVGELRRLQRDGIDPDTQQPFTSADRLVEAFLQRNLPDPNEVLWNFPATGKPTYVGESDSRLQDSPAFPALVERMRTEGGTHDLVIGGTRYRIAVQPVLQSDERAVFVVSHNVNASRDSLNGLILTYALLGALSVVLIAAIASWLAGRLLRPVTRLRDTAQGITEGDLGGRLEVTGNDDLTDLQRTFNAMLDRLEDAFASQRRLLDDAAHELRTPLTVLRGHLEVVDAADAEDVEATRALLLDEVDRMARLVSDLLLLAKAQRPDFVRLEPTDVEALTNGALDRARALGDRSWTLDSTTSVLVQLDAQRITQALLQLAQNAVQHTTPGDEIGIGSDLHGDQLELWIRDTGDGVPASMRADVFERFSQGESTHEGFGLGLSIVSAIAEAHDGRAELVEQGPEGSGATFRLSIPVRAVP